jgi:hypothetical protein
MMVSSCNKNLIKAHPSACQKKHFPWCYQLRALFSPTIYWAMWCDVIPCSVILFPDHSDKISFHHPSQCYEESYHPSQHTSPETVRKHFFTYVCTPLSESQVPSGQKLSDNPKFPPSPGLHIAPFQSLLPFVWLSCVNSLWWDYWFFLYFFKCRELAERMTMVPFLKCFAHHLILLAPTQVSSHVC